MVQIIGKAHFLLAIKWLSIAPTAGHIMLSAHVHDWTVVWYAGKDRQQTHNYTVAPIYISLCKLMQMQYAWGMCACSY